ASSSKDGLPGSGASQTQAPQPVSEHVSLPAVPASQSHERVSPGRHPSLASEVSLMPLALQPIANKPRTHASLLITKTSAERFRRPFRQPPRRRLTSTV